MICKYYVYVCFACVSVSCVCVLPVCIYVHRECAWCPWRSEEGVGTIRTEFPMFMTCHKGAGN